MNSSKFQRISAASLALAGILIGYFWICHPEESLLLTNPTNYQLEHLSGFFGTLLLPLGLIGLYGRYTETSGGRIGLVGFILTLISALLSIAINTVDTFIWPAVAKVQPSLILTSAGHFDQTSEIFSATFPLIIATILLVILGYSLFSVALWQARTFPRAATAFLVLGAMISVVGPEFVPHGEILLGLLVYSPLSAAMLWLGVHLWNARDSEAGMASSSINNSLV